MTSRSNFTCVQSTFAVGGRKSIRRSRTESRRCPELSLTTCKMPAQLSCFDTSSVFPGIRISAKTPEGACNRRGPSPAGCSSTVFPIGSSRFKRLQTPTYWLFFSAAASSTSGVGRQTRAGGPIMCPSRESATVAAGISSSCTSKMTLASAAGKTRHLILIAERVEPSEANTVVATSLPRMLPALGKDASRAIQGVSTLDSAGAATARRADSGTTTAPAPTPALTASAAILPEAPP
jgi:hypothetical protein